MRYLNGLELSQLHTNLLQMCEKHAINKGKKTWGFPHGIEYCDTYIFKLPRWYIYIGHLDFQAGKRWWFPVVLNSLGTADDLSIDFEMCIPKIDNPRLSVRYTIDDTKKLVHVLHKGKFTVGYGSVRMADFFDFYKNNPGEWPIIRHNFQDYLQLGAISLPMTDGDFTNLLSSLAEFANYIPNFKKKYRVVQ